MSPRSLSALGLVTVRADGRGSLKKRLCFRCYVSFTHFFCCVSTGSLRGSATIIVRWATRYSTAFALPLRSLCFLFHLLHFLALPPLFRLARLLWLQWFFRQPNIFRLTAASLPPPPVVISREGGGDEAVPLSPLLSLRHFYRSWQRGRKEKAVIGK